MGKYGMYPCAYYVQGTAMDGTPGMHIVSVTNAEKLPRMPDATRGFTMGRGRPLVSAS